MKRLIFDPITEHVFQTSRSLRMLLIARYGSLIGFIIFLTTAPLEIFILQTIENQTSVWIISWVSSSFMLLLFGLSFLSFFHARTHYLIVLAAIGVSMNNTFYFSIYIEHAAYAFVMTQIITLYLLSIIAPNHRTTILCSLVIVFLPLALAFVFKLEKLIHVQAYYYLILTVVIICFMSFINDQKNRWAFKTNRQLENDKEQMKILATKDSLTGCYNRRYFYDIFEKEYQKAQRYNLPLTILMIDIDHFKKIVTTHPLTINIAG